MAFETKITWYSPAEKLPSKKECPAEYVSPMTGSIEVMIVFWNGNVEYGTYSKFSNWCGEHRNINKEAVKAWAYKPTVDPKLLPKGK